MAFAQRRVVTPGPSLTKRRAGSVGVATAPSVSSQQTRSIRKRRDIEVWRADRARTRSNDDFVVGLLIGARVVPDPHAMGRRVNLLDLAIQQKLDAEPFDIGSLAMGQISCVRHFPC